MYMLLHELAAASAGMQMATAAWSVHGHHTAHTWAFMQRMALAAALLLAMLHASSADPTNYLRFAQSCTDHPTSGAAHLMFQPLAIGCEALGVSSTGCSKWIPRAPVAFAWMRT